MRKLFLLLTLIVAGAQSAWADTVYKFNRDTVQMNGVNYETIYLSTYSNFSVISSNSYYSASIISIPSGSTSISVPSEITIADKTYNVRSVGTHTYLKDYPTRYFFDFAVPTTYGWGSEWKDDTGYHSGSNKALDTDVEYSAVPVNNSNSGLKNLTFQGGIEIYGPFTSNSLETLNFQGETTIKGDMLVVGLRNLNLKGALDISGTLTSDRLTEIHFNKLTCSGKFECKSLTDVYFPTLKYGWIGFSGSSFTGVSFSGSQWEDHFPSSLKKQIRAHVWDLTSEQLAKLKNSAIWCDFKEIVNHKSNVNYTIATDGNARIDFVELKGNASYVSATGISQIAFTSSGSKSGSVKGGGNYAVEIRDVDFNAKNVQLLRNGHVVTLEPYEDQGQPIRYYEDLDLHEDVRYEVTVTDKTCNFTLTQTGYRGKITYTKTLNGTTSSGLIYTSEGSFICAQGSTVKLSIPYDQYTPKTLELNGSYIVMNKANGRATATITVPVAETAAATLTWEAPAPLPDAHELPQVMVMRMGQGDVVLKDFFYTDDEQEMDYWRLDEPGWALRKIVNCEDAVTTSSISDLDGYGELLGEERWGFIVEATPLAGQTVKTFLLGRVPHGSNMMVWEDVMHNLTIDSSGKCTLDICGDYMNYGPGNYTVLVEMGPEETAVETGQTFNFVRKGGRGESWIFWEDTDYDFYFEEGSISKTIPNEQLTDVQMHIVVKEGESFYVYKDGVDITGQFQLNGSDDYWAELETKSATYTVLIEDAPNANPTWSIHNATEGDVIVEQTLKDGTTTTTTYAGNLNDLVIDDTQVSKVTLKVYAENANEAKPVRVLVNGQDVSYQFSTKQNDGDGFRLCYEVPVSELTNCSWDISYNTDRPQTFVVKGGTCNLLMEFYYENLESEPVLDISLNDGPATVYLPPFNSEWNRYVNMTVNADEYEGLTIKRNGIDVTNYFTKTVQSNGKKYYELDIAEGDLEGNSTVGLLSFDIRDAAVWEIVYKSVEEQMKTLRVSNLDQMEIVYERNYTDGTTASEYFKNSETGEIAEYVERIFDDSDRENTSSVYLKVPFKDANYQYYPVRVLCNGEDVTYQFSNFDPDGYLIYETNVEVDQTWDISRDVSHRQTFIRKGGTTWNVEVEFDFPVDGDERYFSPDAVGTPLYVDFPTYNSIYAPNAYIYIDVEDGSSFSVLRNGVDVKDKFKLVTGSAGASAGFTRYALYESDYNVNNDGMTPGLGFTFRDPAVWEITIDDGNSDAVEYMFIGDYDKVYASADYNNDVDYEGFEFTQQNVEGYYAGKVVENGTALGKQGAVEFWLPAGKTFRAFYDGTDMTNQFTDYYNNGHWLFVSEDDWMHQPGHHWTIIAESDLMKYDTNRDGQITIADVTKLVNKVLNK